MTIPKYVKEIMWRSEYCYIFPKSKAVDCSPGYTVTVKKATKRHLTEKAARVM